MIYLNKIISASSTSSNPLRNVFTFLLTIAMFGLILMFSAVFFAIIVILGLIAWAYLWWKTRALRKQMQQQTSGQFTGNASEFNSFGRQFSDIKSSSQTSYGGGTIIEGEIIEGEAIRVIESNSQGNH